MNSLAKILILSTLIIFVMGSASAVFTDLNAWDANYSRHANKGEDFNVQITVAQTSDINADQNYILALNYGGKYVDLNVKSWQNADSYNAAGWLNDGGDANVEMRSVNAAGTGPCAVAGDVNILVMDRRQSDTNTFNITVTVPTAAQKGQIDHLVGHEVTVEMWEINSSNQCGSAAAATARFVIGPAIVTRTPDDGNLSAVAGQSITVIGLGFTPSLDADKNVTVGFWDANGTALIPNMDVNITDTAHGQIAWYHAAVDDVDTNDAVEDVNAFGIADGFTWDSNGITVHPDANGEFDVNITVPYMSDGTIGRPDLNTLRVRSPDQGDVNAFGFVIGPNITMPEDVNVTVTINGVQYDLNTAIKRGLITDLQNVGPSNSETLIIRLGAIVDDNVGDQVRAAVIKFNEDVNIAKAATRDYGTDMNAVMGRVRIDTDTMPEFKVDANVFLYNVRMPSGTIPFLAKDGIVCATSFCTNLNRTDLSEGYIDTQTGVRTWKYNYTTGDGNLAFRVKSLSLFEATSLTVEVLTPTPWEKLRVPRYGVDENYAITFRFKDLNIEDNNITHAGGQPMQAKIYYSDYNGAKTGVIINDTNLLDSVGIRCGNVASYSSDTFGYFEGNTITDDLNLATWNTCQFDLNRGDINGLFGEYVIDVNVVAPWGAGFAADRNRTVIGHTDGNVFFNPPLIEITDANLNSQNFVINYLLDGVDINYVVDFNIYLPDVNRDQNFTLADYNIHFYLSSEQGGLTQDLNIADVNLMFDQNFTPSGNKRWIETGDPNKAGFGIVCTEPPTTAPYLDYNCQAQFDVNNIWDKKYYLVARIMNNRARTVYNWQGGNPGLVPADGVSSSLDVNELWDINSSKFDFTINDKNKPRTTGVTTTTAVSSNTYTYNLQCDDNSSGISNYYFKEVGGNWIDNGTSSSVTFTESGSQEITRTFYGGCKDYAGNISDMNETRNITFKVGGNSPSDTPAGPVGPGGTPSTGTEAGTETLVDVEAESRMPTSEDVQGILEEAGLGQAAIDAAMATATKTNVGQSVKVEKTTSSTGAISYKTTVTVRVKNDTAKKWDDVKVVVQVPKALATRADEISSGLAMKVLKSDPIIEFSVPVINAGQTYDLVYTVASSVSETVANNMPIALVTAYTEAVPCENVVCPDEACRTGICNPGTELCEYENKAEGTVCGENMECQSGACVAKEVTPPPEGQAPDYTTAIIVIVVVVILAAIGVVYYGKRGKKKPVMGKK